MSWSRKACDLTGVELCWWRQATWYFDGLEAQKEMDLWQNKGWHGVSLEDLLSKGFKVWWCRLESEKHQWHWRLRVLWVWEIMREYNLEFVSG